MEWNSESMIKKIASLMGKVLEVKTDARGPAFQKIGKARMKLDVAAKLRVGQLMCHGNKRVWLDFKYERLPFFCYSCGKFGHYATYCPDIPYDEEKFATELGGCFGSWLKAETFVHSSFKKVFYNEVTLIENDDEVVHETPEQPRQSEVMEDGQLRPPNITHNIERGGQEHMLLETNHNSTQEITMYNAGKRALMITGPEHSNNPNFQPTMTSNSTGKKTLLQPKTPSTKKQKRTSNQSTTSTQGWLDETQLMDTPIQMTEEVTAWAVVASPNKPSNEP